MGEAVGRPQGRNPAIDVIRGSLIVLVMVGHILELEVRDNFLTWFGFGFRMPLFVGLSGYLFNLERTRTDSFARLVSRQRDRLVIPWVVACTFYLVAGTAELSALTPLHALIRPPYHLWFVPIILCFYMLARAVPLGRRQMLLCAAPFSLTAMVIFGVGHDIEQYHEWVPDRRYFVYPLYFALGMWMAEKGVLPRRWIGGALLSVAIGALWWSWLYAHPDSGAELVSKLMLNLPLIALLPWAATWPLRSPFFERIGVDSLFFYFWHPLLYGLLLALGVPALAVLPAALVLLFVGRAGFSRLPTLSLIMGTIPVRRSLPLPVVPPSPVGLAIPSVATE